ncbi:MAG: dihydroneopterin aldolase [Planctomycetota bacterium]
MGHWDSRNKIILKNLEFFASVGIYDIEKKQKQPVIVDCDLYFSFEKATQTDTLEDTLNYEEIQSYFQSILNKKHFFLIESMASSLMDELFFRFPQLRAAQLVLKKPNAFPKTNAFAAIELHRERLF